MTLNQLKLRFISALPAGHGHYKISFIHKGKTASGITTNMGAVDRVKDHNLSDNEKDESGYTLKQAYEALYNDAKANS